MHQLFDATLPEGGSGAALMTIPNKDNGDSESHRVRVRRGREQFVMSDSSRVRDTAMGAVCLQAVLLILKHLHEDNL